VVSRDIRIGSRRSFLQKTASSASEFRDATLAMVREDPLFTVGIREVTDIQVRITIINNRRITAAGGMVIGNGQQRIGHRILRFQGDGWRFNGEEIGFRNRYQVTGDDGGGTQVVPEC